MGAHTKYTCVHSHSPTHTLTDTLSRTHANTHTHAHTHTHTHTCTAPSGFGSLALEITLQGLFSILPRTMYVKKRPLSLVGEGWEG
jgi:hypothetical protein